MNWKQKSHKKKSDEPDTETYQKLRNVIKRSNPKTRNEKKAGQSDGKDEASDRKFMKFFLKKALEGKMRVEAI